MTARLKTTLKSWTADKAKNYHFASHSVANENYLLLRVNDVTVKNLDDSTSLSSVSITLVSLKVY